MNVYRLRNLCFEIYKTINKLNPEFVNNISKVKENKRVVVEQHKLLNGTRLLLGQNVWKYMDQRSGIVFLLISKHLKI